MRRGKKQVTFLGESWDYPEPIAPLVVAAAEEEDPGILEFGPGERERERKNLGGAMAADSWQYMPPVLTIPPGGNMPPMVTSLSVPAPEPCPTQVAVDPATTMTVAAPEDSRYLACPRGPDLASPIGNIYAAPETPRGHRRNRESGGRGSRSHLCGDPHTEDVRKTLEGPPVCEPGRTRVPAVKLATGSESNLSCCSSHTPTIYKENRVKGAKAAAY